MTPHLPFVGTWRREGPGPLGPGPSPTGIAQHVQVLRRSQKPAWYFQNMTLRVFGP
jgi:hypothetical protein